MGFFKEFVSNTKNTGAIAPSCNELAELISQAAAKSYAKNVVEFGTGTGIFTRKIKDKLAEGTNFFAFEINPTFYEISRQLCPDVPIYNDSACNVRRYLDNKGINHCDLIISSLPWAAFDAELQLLLLNATKDALIPGGRFLTFAYLQGLVLPSGRRFNNLLKENFSKVKRTRVIWRNVPPAFIYYCKK